MRIGRLRSIDDIHTVVDSVIVDQAYDGQVSNLALVYGQADYVLTLDATIWDGDTFGQSEVERITICCASSE